MAHGTRSHPMSDKDRDDSPKMRSPATIAIGLMTPPILLIVFLVWGFTTETWFFMQATNLLWMDTEWAPNYSEEAFHEIREGDSAASVRDRLGAPLYRRIFSSTSWRTYESEGTAYQVSHSDWTVIQIKGPNKAGVKIGDKSSELFDRFGPLDAIDEKHDHEAWYYSRSPTSTDYWFRAIGFDVATKTVTETTAEYWWD